MKTTILCTAAVKFLPKITRAVILSRVSGNLSKLPSFYNSKTPVSVLKNQNALVLKIKLKTFFISRFFLETPTIRLITSAQMALRICVICACVYQTLHFAYCFKSWRFRRGYEDAIKMKI